MNSTSAERVRSLWSEDVCPECRAEPDPDGGDDPLLEFVARLAPGVTTGELLADSGPVAVIERMAVCRECLRRFAVWSDG